MHTDTCICRHTRATFWDLAGIAHPRIVCMHARLYFHIAPVFLLLKVHKAHLPRGTSFSQRLIDLGKPKSASSTNTMSLLVIDDDHLLSTGN